MIKFNKKGNGFVIKKLGLADVDTSFALLTQVAEEMKAEGHENYILPKSKEKISGIIADEQNLMAGVFLLDKNGQEGPLVAEMGYFGVDSNAPRDDTDGEIPHFAAENVPNEDVSLIGSVCVSKEFRGLGFFKKMDAFLAKQVKARYFVSMTVPDNYKSFGHFLEAGFFLTQMAIDPLDNAEVFYFAKDSQHDMSDPQKAIIKVPIGARLYKQRLDALLEDGFVGCGFEKQTKSILFRKGTDVLSHFGYKARPGILNHSQAKARTPKYA